jgi:hypothetical protein
MTDNLMLGLIVGLNTFESRQPYGGKYVGLGDHPKLKIGSIDFLTMRQQSSSLSDDDVTSNRFLVFSGSLRSQYRVHICPSIDCILNQLNTVKIYRHIYYYTYVYPIF